MKILALLLVMFAGLARADVKADRAALGDALTKLSASATALGKAAKAADDRGARKKFAPMATELGDDLSALVRRIAKDVPLKTVAGDAAEADKTAAKLVELADEIEDKEERKTMRAQASLIAQGVAVQRKQLDAVAAAEGAGGGTAAAAQRFTGRLVNNSDSCSWAENLKFVVSRNGAQVFASQLVFPGKDQPLVLERGGYLVVSTDVTGKQLAQGNLDANREGWMFKSGCVNQN